MAYEDLHDYYYFTQIPLTTILKAPSDKKINSNHSTQPQSDTSESLKQLEHRTTTLCHIQSATSNPKLKPPNSQSHLKLSKHNVTGGVLTPSSKTPQKLSSGEKTNKLPGKEMRLRLWISTTIADLLHIRWHTQSTKRASYSGSRQLCT